MDKTGKVILVRRFRHRNFGIAERASNFCSFIRSNALDIAKGEWRVSASVKKRISPEAFK
jgi:hypothetical protein